MKVSPIPWPFLAAALVSFAALAITARGLPLLVLYTALIGASYVTETRVGTRPFLLRWFLRFVLIIIAYSATIPEGRTAFEAFGNTQARNRVALICAGEVVLQFWRRRDNGDTAQSPLIISLLSGFIFLSASNTFEDQYIRWFAPLFVLLLAVGYRDYRARGGASATLPAARLGRGAALLAVLLVGLFAFRTVTVFRSRLVELGNRLIENRTEPDSTGMSSQPVLGSTFNLRGSPKRVLRLENFNGDPHLHGMAFDTYGKGIWSPAVGERQFVKIRSPLYEPPGVRRIAVADQTEVTATRLVNESSLLYAPLNASSIDRGEAEEMEYSRDAGGGGPFRVRSRAPYEYTITLPPDDFFQGIYALPFRDTPDGNRRRERFLQTTSDLDVDLRPLALGIAGNLKNDKEKIAVVTAYLLSNHKYSLSFQLTPGTTRDPVADFLLSTPKKAAHCEYFAASAALLLRYVGVPTRYVTGYYAHESGDAPNQTIIRQRDAHAWCEAWVEGTGWIVVDATPGDGRPDFAPEPVEWWRGITEWVEDTVQAIATFVAKLTQAQVNAGLGIVVTSVAGYWGFRWARSMRRAAREKARGEWHYASSSDARLTLAVTRFERVLQRRRKTPFPSAVPYDEYLRRPVGTSEGDAADAAFRKRAELFVHLYETVRWSGRASDTDFAVLQKLLHDMETKN